MPILHTSDKKGLMYEFNAMHYKLLSVRIFETEQAEIKFEDLKFLLTNQKFVFENLKAEFSLKIYFQG